MIRAVIRPPRGLGLALGLALSLGLGLGCQNKPRGHPSLDATGPQEHTRRDLDLSAEQEEYLASLAAAADEHPEDFDALLRSGLAHMNFTLAGVLRLRDRAEHDLEAAFALNPNDPLLNRTLGRFYNMRAVDDDFSKADEQVRVYAALLGDQAPEAMDDSSFVAYSFLMLGRILTDKNRGDNFKALAKVGELEDQLAERVRRQPDNIEFRALAGNFAFFFAGNIPLQRERRVREAVAYFEVLRARWDELRVGARSPTHCPNTRENFMFELAEGYMVLDQGPAAREIYEELAVIGEPRTRAKELIAHVASERLRNFDQYLGEMRLMPPWPSDVANCVVCHAWSSEVGLESLYSVEEIELSDIPSKAALKPIVGLLNMDDPALPRAIAGRELLPGSLASTIEAECAPCHFEGGGAVAAVDLSSAKEIQRRAASIEEQVSKGAMPPGRGSDEGGLDEGGRAMIREWVAGLEQPESR